MTQGPNIQHFHLQRNVDETGMSGTGKVAEGVILPNGTAVMWWLKPPWGVNVYSSVQDLENLHGHGERRTTDIVYGELND